MVVVVQVAGAASRSASTWRSRTSTPIHP